MKRTKRTSPPAGAPPERRSRQELREVLDDLVHHVRHVARHMGEMTPNELAHARERLEWFADEVWRVATEGD